MHFAEFAQYLQKLEITSKRLEITDILVDLINNLSPEETEQAINLALGQLKAPFESQKFNIAEKMMIRVLTIAYNTDEEKVKQKLKETGDLGDVAEKLCINKENSKLSILEVYEVLFKISQFEGSGSQDKKISHTAELLQKLNVLSAKYAVRVILGTTRLGFTALTIIDALSNVVAGDKSLKKQIEAKYNVYPDIALITKKIKTNGLDGIEDIKMETGVPIMPQKPQRLSTATETIEKMGGSVIAEYKLDGTRVQLHLDRNKKSEAKEQVAMFDQSPSSDVFAKTFTRNLDETTHQFPDIILSAIKQIDADSVILDGEAIGFDFDSQTFLPFQETIQRKRKHDITETAEQIPLKYMVFDVLYLNGKNLLNTPLTERRQLLEKVIKPNGIITTDDILETQNPEDLEKYFLEAKDKKLEGLVVKNPNNGYEAGARSFSWVKLKRLEDMKESTMLADTIDCAVLGYYYGRGARSQFGIGGFLAGIYDKASGEFKTLTKVGSGLKDDEWKILKDLSDKSSSKEKPKDVGDVSKDIVPDVWVKPTFVVEIKADEISKSTLHSAGYALRFPRLERFRKDKSPQDTTSVNEISQLYNLQTGQK